MNRPCAAFCVLLLFVASCGGGGQIQVPQGTPPQQLAIDVASVDLNGEFLLNGVLFPMSAYETGTVFLLDGDQGFLTLGKTMFNDYSIRIIPDTYSSVYEHDDGGSVVPVNRGADVATGLNIAGSQTLDIDVPSVVVRGAFTLDGGAFPASQYEYARFLLRPTNDRPAIVLGETHLAPEDINLVPGTYDVVYQLQDGGATIPINENAVVMSSVVISTDTVLTIDVPSVLSRAVFTLDGSAFPVSQYTYADFCLRNPATGDTAQLGRSYQTGISNTIIEGTYDLVYKHRDGAQIPANKDAVLAVGITIDSSNSAVSVDVRSATIMPSFTQNGSAFGGNQYNRGDLFLRGSTDDDLVLLGTTVDNSPDPVVIVRGTYDVAYSHVQGDAAPANAWATVASGVVLEADQALPIDVESVVIEPSFQFNGGNWPVTEYDDGEFELRNVADPDDRFVIGDTWQNFGTDPVRVIEGTYDVLYTHETGGTEVPTNVGRVVQAAVPLLVGQLLPINVQTKEVAPTFTLNGGAFPASQYESARFWVRDSTNGDVIFLGDSYGGNAPVVLILGMYDVLYEHSDGVTLPRNRFTKVGTLDVQ